MSMFQGATNVAITGGTQIAVNSVTINQDGQAGLSIVLDKLSAAAAHTALHDSSARFPAPRCHRNTRTTYLDAFERWMLGLEGEYDSKRLIWLNGGAGAGKSAIMQSIIERCAQHAVVLGSFFFSRADPSRNCAEALIPTLAYQLVRGFPGAMAVLEPVIQRDPLIFKASLRTQAYELLVRPLLHLVETGVIDSTSPHRRVFVIDGLDECDDREKQAHIIHVVAGTICDYDVPISFLIASRPETAISRAFQMENRVHSVFSSVTLDDNVEASSDIRQFIEDSFLDIRDTHPQRKHIPSNWPDCDSVDELVWKSSGHFVYAATAMKFISSSDEHPTRALQVVEGLVSSRIGNPFAELDALYLHILTSAKYSSQVLAILRHCVLTSLDNSIKVVCFMYPDFSPEDVELFLSDVHALVSLSLDDNAEMCISLKHASLSDFFWDENRSHGVYMDARDYRASLLPRYSLLFGESPQSLVLSSLYRSSYTFTNEFISTIRQSQDVGLLQSFIRVYSPRYIWNFYCGINRENNLMISGFGIRGRALYAVSFYLEAIRDSAANHDNALYIHHFEVFVQVLIEELSKLIEMEPHYRIIPALMFSSSPSCLTSVAPHLIFYFPQPIQSSFTDFFRCMLPNGVNFGGVIDPRSYEAIRSLPQSRISWGSDLSYALQIVLEELLGYTWTPECLCPNPHERWLNKMKPFKHMSQGSPKISSAFYSYLRTLPPPKLHGPDVFRAFLSHGFRREDVQEIDKKREQCFVYLQTVIHYLHKCDSTSELAKLARRSLPKAALWFPKLMKRARRKMDAYVRRWEESLDGLFEKTRSLFINDMD